MDTRPPIEPSEEFNVLSVSFNDDESHFAAGLNSGFAIYETSSCKLDKPKIDLNGGIGLAQMLKRSNIVALVGGGRQPRFPQHKVTVWDNAAQKLALELSTLSPIRGVQLDKRQVVVVLQNTVRVYDLKKPPKLLFKYETADNHLGLCRMTEKYLVFPGRTAGQVQVVDRATESVSIIPAHNSSLRAISLSRDGEFLATASEKGTIIRIFNTGSCAKIAERRRGSDYAFIYSLGFSPSARLLACTSDKGSLHVFDVFDSPLPGDSALSSPSIVANGGPANPDPSRNKWGFLANIPFGPFADVYSFASIPFETGDEPAPTLNPTGEQPVLGTSRPAKGIIGWVDERTLVVVGAGYDARWEKFSIIPGEEGRYLNHDGWKHYAAR